MTSDYEPPTQTTSDRPQKRQARGCSGWVKGSGRLSTTVFITIVDVICRTPGSVANGDDLGPATCLVRAWHVLGGRTIH